MCSTVILSLTARASLTLDASYITNQRIKVRKSTPLSEQKTYEHTQSQTPLPSGTSLTCATSGCGMNYPLSRDPAYFPTVSTRWEVHAHGCMHGMASFDGKSDPGPSLGCKDCAFLRQSIQSHGRDVPHQS